MTPFLPPVRITNRPVLGCPMDALRPEEESQEKHGMGCSCHKGPSWLMNQEVDDFGRPARMGQTAANNPPVPSSSPSGFTLDKILPVLGVGLVATVLYLTLSPKR